MLRPWLTWLKIGKLAKYKLFVKLINMSFIYKQGKIPPTPHTEFYSEEGVLALEEIHGSQGFGGPWSRKLHYRCYPTEQKSQPVNADFSMPDNPIDIKVLEPYVIQTGKIPFEGNALSSRKILIAGNNTRIGVAKFTESMKDDSFFRNGEMHELLFIQDGNGILKTDFGNLNFKKNVYVVIPKGTTYRIELESKKCFIFSIESKRLIDWPKHYLNSAGQAHMSAPIVETEIDTPVLQKPIDQEGSYPIYVQHNRGMITKLELDHHPFDVIGWEGSLYPFVFDIKNHHGIARAIHVSPPAHQTFESGDIPNGGFAVCSFVPQPNGWHEKEVPAPYAHYNIDSDEVMFFANTDYGPRKDILEEGTLTFHPSGTPHSPHGKAAAKSLSSRGKMSNRLAVMMDTFMEDLYITSVGWDYRDKEYATSWHKAKNK